MRLYHLIVHGEHARVVSVGWWLIHVHRGEPSVLGLTLVHILSDLWHSRPLESRQQERVGVLNLAIFDFVGSRARRLNDLVN